MVSGGGIREVPARSAMAERKPPKEEKKFLCLHLAAYAACLFQGIAMLAHRYVRIREGDGQPSPQVPLGGVSLFCEDL